VVKVFVRMLRKVVMVEMLCKVKVSGCGRDFFKFFMFNGYLIFNFFSYFSVDFSFLFLFYVFHSMLLFSCFLSGNARS
jgi:hypothetical protein